MKFRLPFTSLTFAFLFGAATGFASTPLPILSIPSPRNFPAQDTFSLPGGRWTTEYAGDSLLQARSLFYLNRFRPEVAVLTVCDLHTGMIRSLAERDSSGAHSRPRLALTATFPAASLIKILTASAALESKNLQPSDLLPLLGRSHTLYHFQLKTPRYQGYPKISLENAFARSVNPVFGALGMHMGAETLRKMGVALGFNQSQSLPECRPSRLEVPDSGFNLAQVACGFTTSTTISPLHALRIARSIGDDGRMCPLVFTPALRNLDNGSRFTTPPTTSDPFVSPATLDSLRVLMAATVSSGTAHKGFLRAFRRRPMTDLELGGKTGSLDGMEPPGRYEWYVGYARLKEHPDRGIAITAMIINQSYRTVHASELAALLIRDWDHPPHASTPSRRRYSRHLGKNRRPTTYARR